MNTHTITFEKLNNLIESCNAYAKTLDGKKTKLSYAIERISRSLEKGSGELQLKINDLRTDYAQADEKGILIIKEGVKGTDRYCFTKENEKKFRKAVNDLMNESVIIDGYIATEVPDDLTFNQIEDFKGILIPADYEQR
jgi:hypothetical protein